MKKTILVVMAGIFFIVGRIQAQNAQFGIKAGVNVASLHSNTIYNMDPRTSIYAGGLVHIHLNKYFAVQPELLYSCQGTSQMTDGGKITWRLNYVNLPVLLQYMFDNGFRLQTGPQLGLLASAREKLNGVISNVQNYYTTADLSWSFGAGYLTPSGLGIDARYNVGISNINNTGGHDELQNRVFQVGLFYQFKD